MSSSCEVREVYTIKVDSSNVSTAGSNAATFTAYLPVPLTNVVKVEVLSACITPTTNASPIVYLYIDELTSKFIDRAKVVYTISSAGAKSNTGSVSAVVQNESILAEALVAIPVDRARVADMPVIYTSGGYFPTTVDYINPIRRLDKMSVSFYDSKGVLIAPTANIPSFLTLRFECAKNNSCLY